MSMLEQMLYMPKWFFMNRVLGQEKPLQTVLMITDYCNLSCRHCMAEGHSRTYMKTYAQIWDELAEAYELGSRFIDFEGGEPTLWRDGDYKLNDLYRLAKRIGFFSSTLTTNGQRPFSDTLADSVWVSVDGYGMDHDAVRGKGTFSKLIRNIHGSGHKNLSVAMSVNRLNCNSVGKMIRFVKRDPHIKSIAFNLHTPFPGTEELALSRRERAGVIDEILKYKAHHYPVMNSVSGLSVMKKSGFPKYCWMANYYLPDGMKLKQCPGKELGVCDDCGFCMAGEMYSVMHLKPDTILAGLKLRTYG